MPTWYTGHGMVRTDKPLRKRPADDFYPTPGELCNAALDMLYPGPRHPHTDGAGLRILDPGCGTGAWGRAVRRRLPHARIVGVEQEADRIEAARASGDLSAYDLTLWGDFLKPRRWPVRFDLIIGNPPYSLAEDFITRSLELLTPGGSLLFLLRTAFLESQGRYRRMFSGAGRPAAVYSLVERPSFTGDGKTDATAYSLFYWQAADAIARDRPPATLHWLSWRDKAPVPAMPTLFDLTTCEV